MKNALEKAFKDAGKQMDKGLHDAAQVVEKVATNPEVQAVAKETAIGVVIAAVTAA